MGDYLIKPKASDFNSVRNVWGISDFYGHFGLSSIFSFNGGERLFRQFFQFFVVSYGYVIPLFFYFSFAFILDDLVEGFHVFFLYISDILALISWELSALQYILVFLSLILSILFIFSWTNFKKSYIGTYGVVFSHVFGMYLCFLVYTSFFISDSFFYFWYVIDGCVVFDSILDLVLAEFSQITINFYFFLLSAFLIIFILFRSFWGVIFNPHRRFFFQNRLADQSLLAILALIFCACMVWSNNLFFLFVNWVGLNIVLYSLLGQFSFSLKAQESAIKYFTLGLVAAGFFLFGLWLIYYTFGFLDVFSISAILGVLPLDSIPVLVLVGFLLILSVILFKLSAFPFQAWALDVYEGASWFSLSILVLVVKPIFVLVLIQLLFLFAQLSVFSSVFIFVSGCISLFIGTVGGAFQQKIKRFLAMSSIAHIGFILMILALDPTNPVLALNYLMGYVSANAILILILSSLRISGPLYPVARSVVYWSELIFLNGHRHFRVFYTWYLSLSLFSLAGLPPFFGFFTKLGFFFLCFNKFSLFALVGAFTAFLLMPVSVFSYLRIVRLVWFGDCNPFNLVFFVRVIPGNCFQMVLFTLSSFIVFGGLFILV